MSPGHARRWRDRCPPPQPPAVPPAPSTTAPTRLTALLRHPARVFGVAGGEQQREPRLRGPVRSASCSRLWVCAMSGGRTLAGPDAGRGDGTGRTGGERRRRASRSPGRAARELRVTYAHGQYGGGSRGDHVTPPHRPEGTGTVLVQLHQPHLVVMPGTGRGGLEAQDGHEPGQRAPGVSAASHSRANSGVGRLLPRSTLLSWLLL